MILDIRERKKIIISQIDKKMCSLFNSLRGFKGTDAEFCLLNRKNVLYIIDSIKELGEQLTYKNLTNCNYHLLSRMMLEYGYFKKELPKDFILDYKKVKLSSLI